MITVRSTDGTSVQYNSATYVESLGSGRWRLLTQKDGKWVADVAPDWIIEASAACRVYNPVKQTGDVVGWLIDHMRRMSWSELGRIVELKQALKDFNAQRRTWK